MARDPENASAPRPNLKDPVPCVAIGVAPDGERHTIVCSVGIDVDLVGFVADVQHLSDRPVVVVLKERDRVRIVQDLLDLLARPVTVRTV